MSQRRLPFTSESDESLRGRYPLAVATMVDMESVELGLVYDPGSSREHVFDTEDGLRLIISREDHGEDGKVLHMSASLDEQFPSKFLDHGFNFIIGLVEKRFREISGEKRAFGIVVASPDGIPHWYIFEDPERHKDLTKIRFRV